MNYSVITQTSRKTIKDFGSLSEHEQKFLEDCQVGIVSNFETADFKPDPNVKIRSELIRYMLLGGCEDYRPSIHGIRIFSANIVGYLDLENCHSTLGLTLVNCTFDTVINARNCHLNNLILSGSQTLGLDAQGINVKGHIFLSDGFTAKGEVYLVGATVGGQIACSNGTFENEKGYALNAQGTDVKGDIFLSDRFAAKGEVSLSGATVGGQIACSNGTFENKNGNALNADVISVKGNIFLSDGFAAKGEVALVGATVGGQLLCTNGTFENEMGHALNAQNLNSKSVLFFKNVTCHSGAIDFRFANIGVITDDYDSWPKGRFFLNGLTYKTIIGADITCERRMKWLENHQTDEFEPQPYEQLAKVLRELGHRRDGSLVLEAMEKNLRPDIRNRMRLRPNGEWGIAFKSVWLDIKRLSAFLWDTALGSFVGYGYRPSRAFIWSLALVFLTTFIAYQTWHKGDFVPNSSIVLVDNEWRSYAKDREGNPAHEWSTKSETGRDYETFNPFSYALDVFVPIIDFGQESAWAPSTERGWWGQQLYWLRWLIKTLGWIITALGAAAVTGIIRQDR